MVDSSYSPGSSQTARCRHDAATLSQQKNRMQLNLRSQKNPAGRPPYSQEQPVSHLTAARPVLAQTDIRKRSTAGSRIPRPTIGTASMNRGAIGAIGVTIGAIAVFWDAAISRLSDLPAKTIKRRAPLQGRAGVDSCRDAPAFPGEWEGFTRLKDEGSGRLRKMAASIYRHQLALSRFQLAPTA